MPQLARNIASMYVPRVAGIAASIFLFPFIVHHVGLSHFGLWLLISSTTFFFAQDFGMGVSLIRYVADARARRDTGALNRAVCSTLAFFCGLGFVAALAFAVVMAFVVPSLNVAERDHDLAMIMIGLVAGGYLLIALPLGVFKGVLAGAERYDLVNLVVFTNVLVRCIGIVGVLVAGSGIIGVAAVEAAVHIGAGIAYFVLSRRVVPELELRRRHASLKVLRGILPYSMQVFVMGIAALVVLHADNMIIGIFLPVGMVALYSGAFRIYQACRDIAGSLLHPIVPDASRAAALGATPRLRRLLLDGTKYSNALVLAVAVPVLLFAAEVLDAWVGARYEDVALVTQILVLGLIVNNNHLVAVSLLTGIGRIGAYVRYHAVWAAGNIILSVALISWIGLEGVAIGTTLPLILLEPFYVRVALRELDVPASAFISTAVLRPLVPALVAAVPLVGLGLAAGPQSIVAVLGASLAYALLFGLLFACWGLSPGERAAIVRVLRRLRPGGRLLAAGEASARRTA